MFRAKLVSDRSLGQVIKELWLQDGGIITLPRERKYWCKTGRLYYLKLEVGEDLTLYKIGYTGRTVKERVAELDAPSYVRVTVLEVATCKKAAYAIGLEGRLHEIYKKDRYRGFGYLASGNTEVYVRDVLGLDRGKAKTVISLGI